MMGVDLGRLSGWMDEQGLPPGEIVDVESLGGGTQNILLRFDRGGATYVLRHPPTHKRANSDETMRREARVLRALASTDVPHPRLIAAWPTAQIAVMGAQGAANIVHRKTLKAVEKEGGDVEARRAELIAEYEDTLANPYIDGQER